MLATQGISFGALKVNFYKPCDSAGQSERFSTLPYCMIRDGDLLKNMGSHAARKGIVQMISMVQQPGLSLVSQAPVPLQKTPALQFGILYGDPTPMRPDKQLVVAHRNSFGSQLLMNKAQQELDAKAQEAKEILQRFETGVKVGEHTLNLQQFLSTIHDLAHNKKNKLKHLQELGFQYGDLEAAQEAGWLCRTKFNLDRCGMPFLDDAYCSSDKFLLTLKGQELIIPHDTFSPGNGYRQNLQIGTRIIQWLRGFLKSRSALIYQAPVEQQPLALQSPNGFAQQYAQAAAAQLEKAAKQIRYQDKDLLIRQQHFMEADFTILAQDALGPLDFKWIPAGKSPQGTEKTVTGPEFLQFFEQLRGDRACLSYEEILQNAPCLLHGLALAEVAGFLRNEELEGGQGYQLTEVGKALLQDFEKALQANSPCWQPKASPLAPSK